MMYQISYFQNGAKVWGSSGFSTKNRQFSQDCGAKNLQASNVCIAVRWATDPYDEEEAVKPC